MSFEEVNQQAFDPNSIIGFDTQIGNMFRDFNITVYEVFNTELDLTNSEDFCKGVGHYFKKMYDLIDERFETYKKLGWDDVTCLQQSGDSELFLPSIIHELIGWKVNGKCYCGLCRKYRTSGCYHECCSIIFNFFESFISVTYGSVNLFTIDISNYTYQMFYSLIQDSHNDDDLDELETIPYQVIGESVIRCLYILYGKSNIKMVEEAIYDTEDRCDTTLFKTLFNRLVLEKFTGNKHQVMHNGVPVNFVENTHVDVPKRAIPHLCHINLDNGVSVPECNICRTSIWLEAISLRYNTGNYILVNH